MNEKEEFEMEVRERLARIEILLEKNNENTNEKFKVANHRITDLEDSFRWINRTSIGAIVSACMSIIVAFIRK